MEWIFWYFLGSILTALFFKFFDIAPIAPSEDAIYIIVWPLSWLILIFICLPIYVYEHTPSLSEILSNSRRRNAERRNAEIPILNFEPPEDPLAIAIDALTYEKRIYVPSLNYPHSSLTTEDKS